MPRKAKTERTPTRTNPAARGGGGEVVMKATTKEPPAAAVVVRHGPLRDEGIGLFADLLLELLASDQADDQADRNDVRATDLLPIGGPDR
jgi:hypothetical protein